MTADEWGRVKAIVAGALSRSSGDRSAYLDARCEGDRAIRREADSLLAAAISAAELYEDPTLLVAGASVSIEVLDHLASTPLDSIWPIQVDAPIPAREPFRGTDRYVVRRHVGAGGMGVVYEVEDQVRQQRVALKTLRRWEAVDLYRLKREFRSLADISHPNLVSLHDLVVDDQHCFFTMELVDGVTFVEYVRGSSHGPVDMDRVRLALPQLVDGVGELHRRGRLHRDIKPSNVLVTAEGRVVILDFGLTTTLAAGSADTERGLAGTPAYLSPEQSLGLESTEASDWYAVGATLYHALTGHPPFEGPLVELLQRKTESDPPAPAVVTPDVPDDLSDLCMALLRRDPGTRLSGRDALERTRTSTSPPIADEDDGRESAFVGRESYLDVLSTAFAAVKQGRGASVCIHGPSGIGKSALVECFFDRRVTESIVTLRSRCHEHESVPYKGLDGLIDGLSRYLESLPRDQAAQLMPDDAAAMVRLFPVMRIAAVGTAPAFDQDGRDPVALRRRAFTALRELLRRIAERRPLVLVIDDFHWADADSAITLTELLRPPNPPSLLLLVCFRSEEIDTKPFLRALLERVDQGTRIALPVAPMAEDEVTRLIDALLPPEHHSSADDRLAIAREAGGNPYLVEELTRYVSSGAWTHRGATLEDMLKRRVDSLPQEARVLLETLAVCGRPMIPAHLFAAHGFIGDERPLVARLRAAHFLRSSQSPQHVEIYHDRIRETLAAAVPAITAREIHEHMAAVMVSRGDDDPEALFDHYRAAGHDARAAGYAAEAAVKANSVLAFDRAAALYRHALDLQPLADRRTEWRLGLASALENAGRPSAAADAYLDAARHGDGHQRVEWLRKAAELLLIGGHIDRGLDIIHDVLAEVGMRLARGPRTALASILVRRAQLDWRGLDFVTRAESQIDPDDLLRIDTCWSVTTGLAMVDNIRAASFHMRHLLMALDTGEPYRAARALALEAGFSALGGGAGIERSEAFSERARVMAEGLRHPHLTALLSLTAGTAAFLLGQWARATTLCEQALTILRDECTGVIWEVNLAQNFFLGSLLFRGELRNVSNWLPGLLQAARERGNLYFETELSTRMNLVWLAADDPDGGERQAHDAIARWSAGGFHRQHHNLLLARVQTALYRGRADEAWRLAVEHRVRLRRNLWLRVQFLRIETAFLRARCALAMAAEGQDGRRMRAVAAQDANRITRENMPWSDPLAMLVRATVAHLEGNAEASVVGLERAVDAFQRVDMHLYTAVARRRLAILVGGDRGRALRQEADAWMEAQDVRDPAAMTRLLAPGFHE